jgi:hypothetical protein
VVLKKLFTFKGTESKRECTHFKGVCGWWKDEKTGDDGKCLGDKKKKKKETKMGGPSRRWCR